MLLGKSAKVSFYLTLSVFHVLNSALDVHVECFQVPINFKHNKSSSALEYVRGNGRNDHFSSRTFQNGCTSRASRIWSGAGMALQMAQENNNTDQSPLNSVSSTTLENMISRRNAMFTMLASSSSLLMRPSCASAAQEGSSTKQVKAKGAAEYDLEFYVQNLVKGNKKEGNTQVRIDFGVSRQIN